MTAPTQLVSLRLSEDDIARLEQRVGLDGTRSRSDVIRLAIKSLLDDEPLKAGMGRVTIDLGQDVMPQIEAVHALTGMDARMLTRQGLDLALRHQLQVLLYLRLIYLNYCLIHLVMSFFLQFIRF